MAINGKFIVDHALFDLPEQSAPALGDDVVIVRPDGTVKGERPRPIAAATDKPVGPFAPRANIDINLGNDFRFRGAGADLGLAGTITAMSAPNMPLRAVGNVRVHAGFDVHGVRPQAQHRERLLHVQRAGGESGHQHSRDAAQSAGRGGRAGDGHGAVAGRRS